MNKPIVFISHISEEKDLAIKIKELIEDSFLGMMEVFVSSDETSISAGSNWLDSITKALEVCSIELILCSTKSVSRPWINFEAGAGWIRGIPVIPLCHSGMTPTNLPTPLNLLQAAKISEIPSLKLIFPVLAQAIGAKTPVINFDDFVKDVIRLEKIYMLCENYKKLFKYTNLNINEIFSYLEEHPHMVELPLDLGFVETSKIDLIKTLENNELKDYITISTANPGTVFRNSGAVNGANVYLDLKDVKTLMEFKTEFIRYS